MPDEQKALVPDPKGSKIEHPAKRSRFLFFSLPPYILMILGLMCVVLTEPLRDVVLKYHHPEIPVTAISASPQPLKHDDPFVRRTDLVAYVFEHLGAVIFVAMLIRLAIERRAQEEATQTVSHAVNEEVKKAFVNVNSQINVFNTKVNDVNASLVNVNMLLSNIQVLTGGTLYAQKLRPADREEIATTFLNPVFFRPSYNLTINLTPKEQHLIEVQIEIDSELQNISKQPQPLLVKASLDNVLFQQGAKDFARSSKFQRFEFGPSTAAGREFARRQPLLVSQEDNDNLVKMVNDNLVFEYDPGIEIPPDQIYFVKIYAEQQMRMSDLFVWFMQVATENFKVTVNLAENLAKDNFTVIARPMHHGQDSNFAVQDDDMKKLSWRFENIVLPYQGIQLWWSPKPLTATPPQSDPMPTPHG
jgi:hypothetical protein